MQAENDRYAAVDAQEAADAWRAGSTEAPKFGPKAAALMQVRETPDSYTVHNGVLSASIKRPTLMLRLPDKPMLMLKLLLIHGETDSLQAQKLPWCNKWKPQIPTLSTTVFFLLQSKRPTPMLRLPDKPMLMLKLLLMHGETDILQAQKLLWCNKEQFQKDILSTMVSSQPLSLTPIPMLRLLERLLLISNLLPTLGETDGPITLVQLLTHTVLFNTELFQTDTLSTMVSSQTLSLRPTLMPKPPELLPSLLKKKLMFGETDSLQTLDQWLTMLNNTNWFKVNLDHHQLIMDFLSKQWTIKLTLTTISGGLNKMLM